MWEHRNFSVGDLSVFACLNTLSWHVHFVHCSLVFLIRFFQKVRESYSLRLWKLNARCALWLIRILLFNYLLPVFVSMNFSELKLVRIFKKHTRSSSVIFVTRSDLCAREKVATQQKIPSSVSQVSSLTFFPMPCHENDCDGFSRSGDYSTVSRFVKVSCCLDRFGFSRAGQIPPDWVMSLVCRQLASFVCQLRVLLHLLYSWSPANPHHFVY